MTRPSDLRDGLHVVPRPDEIEAEFLEPFDKVTLPDGQKAYYIGAEAGFVNVKDFTEWKSEVKCWFNAQWAVNDGSLPALDATLLDWAVGMLWPDQTYVSMTQFWPSKSSGGTSWCGFHEARFQMLVGESNAIPLVYNNF